MTDAPAVRNLTGQESEEGPFFLIKTYSDCSGTHLILALGRQRQEDPRKFKFYIWSSRPGKVPQSEPVKKSSKQINE